MPRMKMIILCLFLLGAGLRAVDLWRAVDGSVRESWRECDIASIARNYYREDLNLFYPKIDWRGDSPGYAEMEFPLYPWTIALLYKIFGFHEVLGRLLSYLLSLLVMGIFFHLAHYLLPDLGTLAASLFFVFSPLTVRISNSLQPEGLMFLCYVLAAYAFLRWLDDDSWTYYGIAVSATAFAILAKATAAHIGVFFAILLLLQQGVGALRRVSVWMFAIMSLLPGALWYRHAHHLWLTYGNSLGVSNEYHWIGWDFFSNPKFILKIGRSEVFYVWMFTGVLVAGLGIVFSRNTRAGRYSLSWFAALSLYYILAARTTGDSWAAYYHVVSVPAVAILIGLGTETIGDWVKAGEKQQHRPFPAGSRFHRWNPLMVSVAVISLILTFLLQAWQLYKDVHPADMQRLYACALKFAPDIPPNALIISSGSHCQDDDGYPVAYNASYFFYWLDRKGFNICVEEQSLDHLRAFIQRGARYFIAEKWALQNKPEFEVELREHFQVLQECSGAFLFELTAHDESLRK